MPMPAVSLAAVPGKRARALEMAVEIERRGFTGIYCPSLGDALGLCTSLAHVTSTIRFGTSIEPRGPRKSVSRLPAVYNRLSGAAALANASQRLDVPFVVYDRSVLQDVRGIMNLALQNDPRLPLDQTLDNLSTSGFGPASWLIRCRCRPRHRSLSSRVPLTVNAYSSTSAGSCVSIGRVRRWHWVGRSW